MQTASLSVEEYWFGCGFFFYGRIQNENLPCTVHLTVSPQKFEFPIVPIEQNFN